MTMWLNTIFRSEVPLKQIFWLLEVASLGKLCTNMEMSGITEWNPLETSLVSFVLAG
jgi:hypothetical protein